MALKTKLLCKFFPLLFVGALLAFGAEQLAAEDGPKERSKIAVWEKGWISQYDPVWINYELMLSGGIDVKIKAGAPIGFKTLDLGETALWGKDFIVNPSAAKARQVMRLYKVNYLGGSMGKHVIDVMNKNKAGGIVGFVAGSHTGDGLLVPANYEYVGTPVKWNKHIAKVLSSADSNLIVDMVYDTLVNSGLLQVDAGHEANLGNVDLYFASSIDLPDAQLVDKVVAFKPAWDLKD